MRFCNEATLADWRARPPQDMNPEEECILQDDLVFSTKSCLLFFNILELIPETQLPTTL
jgi:hypothetical protein